MSLFCSAPISKRLNATAVLARDGTAVSLNGLINTRHTASNGYSTEVCNKFRLGFPYDWDNYAACHAPQSCGDQADVSDKSKNSSSTPRNSSRQTILEDVPVTIIRDMPKRSDLKSRMDDILAEVRNPKDKDKPFAEFVAKRCINTSVIDRAGEYNVDDDIMTATKKEQNTRCQWNKAVCSLGRTGISTRRVKRCLKASLGEVSAGYSHNLHNACIEVKTVSSNQQSRCSHLEDAINCHNQMANSVSISKKLSSRKDVSVQDQDQLDNIECHVVNASKKDQSHCYETSRSPRSIRSCCRSSVVQDVVKHEENPDIEATTSSKKGRSDCSETSTSPRSIRSRLRSSVVQDVAEHEQNPDIKATTSPKKDLGD